MRACVCAKSAPRSPLQNHPGHHLLNPRCRSSLRGGLMLSRSASTLDSLSRVDSRHAAQTGPLPSATAQPHVPLVTRRRPPHSPAAALSADLLTVLPAQLYTPSHPPAQQVSIGMRNERNVRLAPLPVRPLALRSCRAAMLRGAPGPANPSLPAASTPTVRSSPNGRAGTCGRAPTRKKAARCADRLTHRSHVCCRKEEQQRLPEQSTRVARSICNRRAASRLRVPVEALRPLAGQVGLQPGSFRRRAEASRRSARGSRRVHGLHRLHPAARLSLIISGQTHLQQW